MAKVAVVYWSGTGNTEAMAEEVVAGAKEKGADVTLFQASEFSADKMEAFDAIAFGCPAMGDEELEDAEFEPMFADCESKLGSKPIALFGSYSWAEGAWMEDWKDRCAGSGLHVVGSVIAYDAPDDEAKEACRALGASLV